MIALLADWRAFMHSRHLCRRPTQLVCVRSSLVRVQVILSSSHGSHETPLDRPLESGSDATAAGDEHELSTREQLEGEVRDNCDALGTKLTAFESAWHVVHLACSKLSSDLTMARSFTMVSTPRHVADVVEVSDMTCEQTYPPIPQACDSNLRAAALVHTPLVECLNAYSMGKSPGFL